ncbi:dolichyl-diphosphooligosaccharide--protein glycosyltransferase subunit 2 [Zootermopsis nevadensis]|uniref:Dolichyl-diphosphooligosaccharide--protein glycosyltransferase subunit 2 n=1 Tax=Zootermopsis nevadensis TaxID=136037 RepID=A0A067QE65_ZOONE|nr:dolichyl-diphosphooligosaccharide--protein glycosyltransferase subunit 2 [Zootermopsis nevadensis]KDQ71487.1 Dolichyl-diphosphooligosaccharide--protein glycosyltransferase subunit 2 [Zootermopsis nevadensis]
MKIVFSVGVSFVVLIGALACVSDGATTTASYLSASDRIRLKQVLSVGWDLTDLPSVHYAVLGYKLLGEAVPKPQEVCKFLLENIGNGIGTPELLYYVTNAWKSLASCGTLPVANIVKILGEVLEQETSTVPDLFFAVQALSNVGQKKGEASKLIKTLQGALKKDDSLLNLGYSFHIAAQLGTDGTFAFDRIEDAVVQADEVDSRFLQFEGGLSITALLVSGAYKLADTVKKPPPITGDQAVKFANYFLSRRSVQTAKGAYSLLEVVNTLTNNKFHLPVAITLASQAAVSLEQPRVSVRVSDLLGKPLSADPLTVTAESATRVGDEVVVLSKKKFEPTSGDRTVYSVNIMETKPERGLYKLSVSAALAKPDPRLVGNVGASLTVKVMCAIGVENVEVGTVDADQTTQAKLAKVAYPNKLPVSVEADSLQKLIMKFSLKDKSTGKLMTVHQAFVKLQNLNTNQEIIFVAEHDSTKMYKFDIDVGSKASEFGHLSGLYSMELIVGDAVLSNSFSWKVADVILKFSDSVPAPSPGKDQYLYAPQPEIKHLFREPERRPPAVVSNLFTGLVLVPLLLLFILWAVLGVNISNFPLSISALGFHLGLGGIFILFGIFWLQLNMFQTIKYLLGIGVVTFLCGNKLLAKIASDRKRH